MSSADDREQRSFESLLDAARSESPSTDLGDRVLEQLGYRERLLRMTPARRSRALVWSSSLLSAAVLLLVLAPKFASDPLISAEHSAGPGALPELPTSTPSASPSSNPRAKDPCAQGAIASGSEPMIDDFEDGDDAIRPSEGRVGFWRWAREIDEPRSAPALIPVPRPDATRTNRFAQHVKGGQLLDWGATVEVDFRPACYDASRYAGLSFQARGPGRIYIAARERAVIPIAEGGSCELDCHNPHVAKVELESSFRTYQIRWTELRQRGIGKPALDARHLHSLAFLIRAEDTPYDVWLDDVRFLQR